MAIDPSPVVSSIEWGVITIEELGVMKDAKLFPGGACEWDWALTGTRHAPGVQPADVEELVSRGAEVVVISRGMDLRLGVMPETIAYLEQRGIAVHVLETRAAVDVYNALARECVAVGAVLHSTC